MALPLSRILLDPRTSDSAKYLRYREVENHYHLEMIASSGDEIVEFQTASLALQAHAAANSIRGFHAIAHLQGEANDRLSQLADGMTQLCQGIELLNEGLDSLNETAAATLAAISEQTGAIKNGFAVMAEQMLVQHKTLLQIAQKLRRPYETQMLELREQADKWLTNGMRNTGRDQEEDYRDAMRLLQEVIKNPIGNQDYVSWFQIGWLRWKHTDLITEAEEAFYRAARLSASEGNLYHVLSTRHLAYMQYLQDRHEDAYQTIRRIVDTELDNHVLFDAARYAAKTGRRDESLSYLDRSIDRVPTTIISMFSEIDFSS